MFSNGTEIQGSPAECTCSTATATWTTCRACRLPCFHAQVKGRKWSGDSSSTTCPGSRCSSWKKAVDVLCQCRAHAHVHLCVRLYLRKNNQSIIFEVGVVTEWVKTTCVSKDYSSFIDKRVLKIPLCSRMWIKSLSFIRKVQKFRYLAVNYIRMVWFSQLVIFSVQALQLVLNLDLDFITLALLDLKQVT